MHSCSCIGFCCVVFKTKAKGVKSSKSQKKHPRLSLSPPLNLSFPALFLAHTSLLSFGPAQFLLSLIFLQQPRFSRLPTSFGPPLSLPILKKPLSLPPFSFVTHRVCTDPPVPAGPTRTSPIPIVCVILLNRDPPQGGGGQAKEDPGPRRCIGQAGVKEE
jgi:hypothetical protein